MCGVVEEFNTRNEERIIIICINPEGGCEEEGYGVRCLPLYLQLFS